MCGTRLHFWPMKHSPWKALALTAAAAALLPILAPAQEESEETAFYRVEAIVFTHTDGEPDGWPVERAADNSDAIDPAWQAFAREQELDRAEDEEAYSDSDLEATLSVVETLATLESGEVSLAELLLYPEPWLSLETLSEPMARARTRLENSGEYRVRAWLAWHQPLDDESRNRAVRIHDQRLIGFEWIDLLPTGRPVRSGRPVESAEDLAPVFHYRLDGTIRLRQRQFMHADVTLDWRVPETVGPLPWPLRPGNESGDADLQTHRLEQSRTIRPERFEYFDSDWLGVLLRVTPWQRQTPDREQDDDGEESGGQ